MFLSRMIQISNNTNCSFEGIRKIKRRKKAHIAKSGELISIDDLYREYAQRKYDMYKRIYGISENQTAKEIKVIQKGIFKKFFSIIKSIFRHR